MRFDPSRIWGVIRNGIRLWLTMFPQLSSQPQSDFAYSLTLQSNSHRLSGGITHLESWNKNRACGRACFG